MIVLIILLAIFYVITTLFLGVIRLGVYLSRREYPNLYMESYKESARAVLRTPLWPLDVLKLVGQVFVDARKL